MMCHGSAYYCTGQSTLLLYKPTVDNVCDSGKRYDQVNTLFVFATCLSKYLDYYVSLSGLRPGQELLRIKSLAGENPALLLFNET